MDGFNWKERRDAALLFVSGMASTSGKSTVCMAILHYLLSSGVPPHSLAYIKPVTQCEGVQPVTKYCHAHNIRHVDLGPIVFRQGVTYDAIEETAEEGSKARKKRLDQVVTSVREVSRGRKFVLIDGLGYAAVGSVAGVSNAQVAAALGVPVLLVGKSGVGDAIDSMNMARVFFAHHNVNVIGALFAKVRIDCERHSYENSVKYVSLFFERHAEEPKLKIYGFVPDLKELRRPAEEEVCVFIPKNSSKSSSCDEDDGVCCHGRSIDVTPEDTLYWEKANRHYTQHLNIADLLFDLLRL